MSTNRTQQLQKLAAAYSKAHPDAEGRLELNKVYRWAAGNKLWKMRPEDEARTFRKQMADALAREHRRDSQGRRHRAKLPVRVSQGGVQKTLWEDIATMTPKVFQKNVAQRRRQIVGDCVQLATDVAHFNDERPDAQIDLFLDFTDDVEERMIELNPPD